MEESRDRHLLQKHFKSISSDDQSNFHSIDCGDRLSCYSSTPLATSLSIDGNRISSLSDAPGSASLPSLSDNASDDADHTALVKRIKPGRALGGPEQSLFVDIHGVSKVLPGLASDSNKSGGIQALGTGVRLPQHSLSDMFGGIDTGPQLADTKEKAQSTVPEMPLEQGSEVHASLLADIKMGITDLQEALIPSVSPAEYLALSRFGGNASLSYFPAHAKTCTALRTFENALKGILVNMGEPNTSFISFSISARSIRLRGPPNTALAMKKDLEMTLNGIRKAPLEANRAPPKCVHRAPIASISNGHERISAKIFAIRKEEDYTVLMTWLKQILPSLPEILARSIGPDYSASLVRQGLSSASAQAVIRIQSPDKPSRLVQSRVQRQVIGLYDKVLLAGSIRLQFSDGYPTLLAGSSCQNDLEFVSHQDNTDEEENTCKFPHWSRIWDHPGMSASIGMRCTRQVSATSCCYVDVDGEQFLLTVNHFIENSRSKNDNSVEDKLSLTSPALLDMDQDLGYYKRFILGVENEIEEILLNQHGDIVPSDLEESSELLDRLDKQMYVQGFEKKLKSRLNDEAYLTLGSVVHQNRTHSRIASGNTDIRHRMDWALFSVSDRAGRNRICYKIDPDEGVTDFFSEGCEEWGAGELCQRTCNVEPNEKVYYVGQTSGLQTAEVNPAPILVSRSCDEEPTLEWALTVPEREQKEDNKYAGDSGAGIMRVSDNSLLGLLWGYENNQLIFTPINDVFADIKEQTGAANVGLPQIWQNPSPSSVSIGSQTQGGPTLICRDITKEPPNARRPKSSDFQLPERVRAKRPTNAPLTLKCPNIKSKLTSPGKSEAILKPMLPVKDTLPSPVPILISSSSSKFESALSSDHSSFAETLIGSIPPTTSHESVVVIKEDSEAVEVPFPEGKLLSQFPLPLQELSERFLGALADKENRISSTNMITDTSDLKPTILKQSSFPQMKRLTDQRRSGTWPKIWSKHLAYVKCG